MYTKKVPYTNFKGEPGNKEVQFNLEPREVFKLLKEFQSIFSWQESIKGRTVRELDTEEVVEFYNNFEAVLLAAYGVMSEDGEQFSKAGRYDFEESAVFSACMTEFVSDPPETVKLVDGLMPKNLQELVKKADANAAALQNDPATSEDAQAELVRLRAQLAEAEVRQNQEITPPAS